jgi:hypothetical protein
MQEELCMHVWYGPVPNMKDWQKLNCKLGEIPVARTAKQQNESNGTQEIDLLGVCFPVAHHYLNPPPLFDCLQEALDMSENPIPGIQDITITIDLDKLGPCFAHEPTFPPSQQSYFCLTSLLVPVHNHHYWLQSPYSG